MNWILNNRRLEQLNGMKCLHDKTIPSNQLKYYNNFNGDFSPSSWHQLAHDDSSKKILFQLIFLLSKFLK